MQEDDELLGHLRLALGQRLISPSSTTWTIFSSIVLPIPGSSLALPSSASCATGAAGLADPRRRRRYEHAEGVLALELPQVGQQLELVGELVVPRQRLGHARDDTAVRAVVCLPTYNERENLEPMLRALGDVLRADDRVLVIDDNSPDGTGELADQLAPELGSSTCSTAAQGGARPGLPRRLPAGARRRRRARPRDGLRLLARPGGRAAPDRGRGRADLVLGSRYVPGGGVANWGVVRRAISRGGSLYARPFGGRCAT